METVGHTELTDVADQAIPALDRPHDITIDQRPDLSTAYNGMPWARLTINARSAVGNRDQRIDQRRPSNRHRADRA